ncbi:MAG: late competence development ComFB family protein [Cyanobacteria bacterium P01_H01_bin.130]
MTSRYSPASPDPATNSPHTLRDRTNVMELLVAEEVDRQLRRCPSTLLDYVKAVEVETYALNRLPPLYAASHEGLEYQKDRARRDYGSNIQTTVRQALIAVQQDPLRRSTPLVTEDDRTRHQRIMELAVQFPTVDGLSQSPAAIAPEDSDGSQASRFRRSRFSRSADHQQSKDKAAYAAGGGWDGDYRYSL